MAQKKILIEEENIYYFPTMTTNVMFVKGEKYVYLGKYIVSHRMFKNKIYTVKDFTVGSHSNYIIFIDEYGKEYYIHPFDCGYFISLKKHRKIKLDKINKASI